MTFTGNTSSPSELALNLQRFAETINGVLSPIETFPSVFGDDVVEAIRFTFDAPDVLPIVAAYTWGVTITNGELDGWLMLAMHDGELAATLSGNTEDSLDMNIRLFFTFMFD
jgi:hypothetical protein